MPATQHIIPQVTVKFGLILRKYCFSLLPPRSSLVSLLVQAMNHFTPPKNQVHQNSNNNEQLSKTNLYIRGLAPNTSDEDLHNLCKQ